MPGAVPMREEKAGFARIVSDIFEETGTLLSQELQIVKAEIAASAAEYIRSLAFFLVAAAFSLIAVLLACQSAIFGLVHLGFAPYAAGLIITAAAAAAALIAFLVARARLTASLDDLASGKRLDNLKTALQGNARDKTNTLARHVAASGKDAVRDYAEAIGDKIAKASREPLFVSLAGLAVVVVIALAIWNMDEE
jgi:hypothetical protein